MAVPRTAAAVVLVHHLHHHLAFATMVQMVLVLHPIVLEVQKEVGLDPFLEDLRT